MSALFKAAVPSALHALTRAEHVAGLAPPSLYHAKMREDMFDFMSQFRTAGFMALRTCFLLAGREVPQIKPLHANNLTTWLEEQRALIMSLTQDEFDEARIIAHRAGFADLEQPAWDYLTAFALPNLWFHLSMMYSILRLHDVDIGKGDFDGLHQYPKGFSF